MILPATALMDIPAEHWAQSSSLAAPSMWEGGEARMVGEKKKMKKNTGGEVKHGGGWKSLSTELPVTQIYLNLRWDTDSPSDRFQCALLCIDLLVT